MCPDSTAISNNATRPHLTLQPNHHCIPEPVPTISDCSYLESIFDTCKNERIIILVQFAGQVGEDVESEAASVKEG